VLELRGGELGRKPLLHELRDGARPVSSGSAGFPSAVAGPTEASHSALPIVFDNFVVEDPSTLDVPSG
jgi:hypothetical protein